MLFRSIRKTVTGFANVEEDFSDNAVWDIKLLPRDKHAIPRRIEDELKKLGANSALCLSLLHRFLLTQALLGALNGYSWILRCTHFAKNQSTDNAGAPSGCVVESKNKTSEASGNRSRNRSFAAITALDEAGCTEIAMGRLGLFLMASTICLSCSPRVVPNTTKGLEFRLKRS